MTDYRTKASSNRSDRRNLFLLVVDSDANNFSYTSMLLHRFNYQIFIASTAEEALQMATVALRALVITAPTLKGMSGFEFMQQLWEYPVTASILFIVLSRQDNLIVNRRCFDLGAVDCLYHSVSLDMLYQSVQVAAEKTPRMSMHIKTSQPVQ